MRPKTISPRIGQIGSRIAAPPKTTDPHYQTAEHRAWSDEVLKRAGYRCESCGRRNCRLFADHKRERRDGGAAFDPANGQALCGSCHTAKTTAARAARQGGG